MKKVESQGDDFCARLVLAAWKRFWSKGRKRTAFHLKHRERSLANAISVWDPSHFFESTVVRVMIVVWFSLLWTVQGDQVVSNLPFTPQQKVAS